MRRKILSILLGTALLAPASPALAGGPAEKSAIATRMIQAPGIIPMARLKVIKPIKKRARVARRKVGWGSGEYLTYRVSLAGVWGGRAAMSVGKVRGTGKRASLRIRGMGETVPFISAIRYMREDLITTVRLRDMAPLKQVADRKAPNRDRLLETTWSAPLKQKLSRDGKVYHRHRNMTAGRFHLDPITALFSLRSSRLKVGDTYVMRVVNGTSMMLVKARVTGKERLYIDGKGYNTVLVEGTGQKIKDDGTPWPNRAPRRMAIWFSRDRARVPVRIEGDTKLGKVIALLTSHKPPRRGLRVGLAPIKAPH